MINILTIDVLNMIVATTALDPLNPTSQEISDAEDDGNAFMESYVDDITQYVRTGNLDFAGTPGIGNDSTTWLDNDVTPYGWTGPTIRDEIQGALVEIYA